MTREEAKREIDFLDYYLQNHTDDYGEESHMAMMMAIQALEQKPSVSENPNNCEMRDATLEERESIDKYIKSISKPTGVKFGALEQEPSGDLISRGEVLENAFAIYTHECGLVEVVGVATIKELPSVKPQTGHWIAHPKGIYAHLICDKCLSNAPYDCRTNYCPNCGCRMVEPQESEG